MKEKELIKVIKQELNSNYIGDDCAYIKNLGIVITQDNLVEDVHFSMKYISPYELGYKSAMVNLSDIAASGGKAECLTVGLSIPNNLDKTFVKDFYNGMKLACKGVEIVGGDITGAEKIFISVTALGTSKGRKISSRSNAKIGQKICVSGLHGSSAAGLRILNNRNLDKENKFVKAHLTPVARLDISENIGKNTNYDYAMMDTSDGLGEALFAISEKSNVKLVVDFDKIPYDKDLEKFENWQDMILFGGEDYELVATLFDAPCGMNVIGEVQEGFGVEINYGNITKTLTNDELFAKTYNHF